MPTKDQMEVVRTQIEWLETARFVRDDYSVRPVVAEPPADAFHWSELVEIHKLDVMASSVDWTGFHIEQQLDVMQNVIDGKTPAYALDGVQPDASPADREYHEDGEPTLTVAEHDAYMKDIAAGYGLTVEQMDDYYEQLATEDEYHVYHTSDDLVGIAATRFGAPMPRFPEDYTHIAVVEANSLGKAFELTNSDDRDWIDKRGVKQARVEGLDTVPRSTSIGDVIVDPEGQAHRVNSGGFERIESSYDRQLAGAAERGTGRTTGREGPER